MRIIETEAQHLDLLYPSERFTIQDMKERIGIVKILTIMKELYPIEYEKAVGIVR